MKTTKESSQKKKRITELIAFNTFQIPVYAAAIAIGSLAQEGTIQYEKMIKGTGNLLMISPLIGPTMEWYMNKTRELFRIKTPEEKNKN